jgi:hypothetical protein
MAKIKTKWIDWAIATILIFNLIRQLFVFIGVAVEGHYTKHEADAIMSELDDFTRNCGNHLIDNLMQHIAREAILNFGLAIFVVAVYFYSKRKRSK